MNILIIGQGGREHAMAWKMAKSSAVSQVFVAPGNGGTHREPKVENVDIDPLDFEGILQFTKDQHIEFTLVGPEAPLVAGLADFLHANGQRCLGPNEQGAQLEGSKVYAKTFMDTYGIPTPKAKSFTSYEEAKDYLQTHSFPCVIKAQGLAQGKGVIIAEHQADAIKAIDDMLVQKQFGQAGEQILVEEFIQGVEASLMILADGQDWVPLATSQDHKARDNGDQGPNTGGMGAYSPTPVLSPSQFNAVTKSIITPTLKGLKERGIHYQGFLYFGLMIPPQGPIQVLEYNCRLGDPEAQVILLRLQSDFFQLCQAVLHHTVNQLTLNWDPRIALNVVLASSGYPGAYAKGHVITGLKAPVLDNCKVFHAGTQIEEGKIKTSGGRVLSACALGETIEDAQTQAYQLVDKIHWEGMFFRNDIGDKAKSFENVSPHA